MNLSIREKKEEPLLSRSRVTADVDFEKATLSYKEASALLAGQLKTDEKLVAIRHIYNDFGHKKAEVIAYVYLDESKKKEVEPKAKEKKDPKAAKKE